jgi:hypothetical protein
MAKREPGKLHESAILVEEVGGERVQRLQVLLSELDDGSWQVHAMQLPRGGREATEHYATEDKARAAAEAIYAQNATAAEWQVSRFGQPDSRKSTTQSKPGW